MYCTVAPKIGLFSGKDYPVPMVDHETASAVNQNRLRQAYKELESYKTKDIGQQQQQLLEDQQPAQMHQSTVQQQPERGKKKAWEMMKRSACVKKIMLH